MSDTIGDILEGGAVATAQDLQTQERLKNPETALREQNRLKLNRMLDAAQDITNRESPVAFDLNPQNPSATIGWSTNNGLNNNGTNFGIAATASGNSTGVNAAVTTTVGNGTLGAMLGTNGASVVFKTNEAPPPSFNLNSIGQKVDDAVTVFRQQQQSAVFDPNTFMGNTR